MIIKSRQDTYQYTHDQKQAGFSADVGFNGKSQSFSINGGKTDVDDPNTLTQAQKNKLISQAKLIAGITAAFAGEDVNVAAGVAAEAVENNAVWAAIPAIIYVLDKAYTAYQVYQDIQDLKSGKKTVEQPA